MLYLKESEMKLKIYDIVFFILIGLIIFIALWLLFGSPTLVVAFVFVAIFFASSELMIWRKIFEMDKNTAIGFMKVKNNLDFIKNKLCDIEELIKNKE